MPDAIRGTSHPLCDNAGLESGVTCYLLEQSWKGTKIDAGESSLRFQQRNDREGIRVKLRSIAVRKLITQMNTKTYVHIQALAGDIRVTRSMDRSGRGHINSG